MSCCRCHCCHCCTCDHYDDQLDDGPTRDDVVGYLAELSAEDHLAVSAEASGIRERAEEEDRRWRDQLEEMRANPGVLGRFPIHARTAEQREAEALERDRELKRRKAASVVRIRERMGIPQPDSTSIHGEDSMEVHDD